MGTLSDRRLRAKLRARLEDDQVDPINVGIRIRRGHVTLTGQVPSHSERLRIRVLATSVVGEGMVVDEMSVRPVGRDWALSDEAIAAGIHEELAFRGLDAGIGVSVKSHVAEVTGHVPDGHTRAMVRHIVQDAPGVHFVDNRLDVRTPQAEVQL